MKKLYFSFARPPGGNGKTEELRAIFGSVREAETVSRPCPESDPFPGDGRIKAIRFRGLPEDGRETSVFAYVGFPEGASARSPVPGMVLVHGGGGHACAEWVRYWTDHGFAAVSFDGYCQIYTGQPNTYDASSDFWKPDPLCGVEIDDFYCADRPFARQGFTYYTADVIAANNLLRSDDRVIKEKIGLTGISWGGVAACVALCFDDRFAFAAPVYGCGFQDVSKTDWGAVFRDNGVSEVWDSKLLLSEAAMPVHFFNGDGDPFFDANSSTACAACVRNGGLTLLPGFTHGQNEGSAIPELLRFAESQTGMGERNITILSLSAEADGARLAFALPEDASGASARIYYKTEDLIYSGKDLREPWKNGEGDAGDGVSHIRIPEEARLFYFCVTGRTADGTVLHATSGVFSRESWEAAETR